MRNQNGFTLVELAVALVVIGLLIGGILKGQELIENAKMNAVMRTVKESDTAASIFMEAYKHLPGDLGNPGKMLPNCTTDICMTGGNEDGAVGFFVGAETCNFFPHMVKAGLLGGVTFKDSTADKCLNIIAIMEERGGVDPITEQDLEDAEAFMLKTQYGPLISLNAPYADAQGYAIPGGPDIGTRGLPGKVMQAFDTKFDDGKALTGSIRARQEGCYALDRANDNTDSGPVNGVCGLGIASEL